MPERPGCQRARAGGAGAVGGGGEVVRVVGIRPDWGHNGV